MIKLIKEILELLWKAIRTVLWQWLLAKLKKLGFYALVLIGLLLLLVLVLVVMGI